MLSIEASLDQYPIPADDEICTKCGAKTESDLGFHDTEKGLFEMEIYCLSCGTEWTMGNLNGDSVRIKE